MVFQELLPYDSTLIEQASCVPLQQETEPCTPGFPWSPFQDLDTKADNRLSQLVLCGFQVETGRVRPPFTLYLCWHLGENFPSLEHFSS